MIQICRSYSIVSQKAVASDSFAGNLLSFVPGHDIGNSDLVESSKEGKGSEYEGRNNPLPLVEDLENASLLEANVSSAKRIPTICDCNEKNASYLFRGLVFLVIHDGLTLAGNRRERYLAPSQSLAHVGARDYCRLFVGGHDGGGCGGRVRKRKRGERRRRKWKRGSRPRNCQGEGESSEGSCDENLASIIGTWIQATGRERPAETMGSTWEEKETKEVGKGRKKSGRRQSSVY